MIIICIEISAHKLRSDREIHGFQIEDLTHMLELYADDCSIFLQPTDKDLRKAMEDEDDYEYE